MADPIQIQDKDSGELVSVTQEQLGDAVNSGRFLVPEGTEVPVLDTDGTVRALPVELISSGAAEAEGIRVAGAADIEEFRKQQQFGEGVGNVVRATAESFANEAMLGAGDAALISSGISTAEGLAERRARNEIASAVGGVGGIVLPVVASGGTGAVARGAATTAAQTGGRGLARGVLGATQTALRATPTALLARGGAAAQQGLTKALGGGIGARLGAAGAVSAAEGAVFGTGQAVSALVRDGEAVLGDHETVAEYLLANAKDGALLGAGAGVAVEGGIAGIGAGVRGVKGLFGRARGRETGLRVRKSEKLPENATDEQIRAAVREDAAAEGLPVDEAEGSIARVLKDRKALRELPDRQDSAIRRMGELGDELEEIKDEVLRIGGPLSIEQKFQAVKKSIRQSKDVADPEIIAGNARAQTTKLRETLDRFSKDPDTKQASAARRLLRVVASADDELRSASRILEDPSAHVFRAMDNLKRSVGDARMSLRGRKVEGTLGFELVGAYDDMARHLESADLYGRRVNAIQAKDNRAWVPFIDAREAFSPTFLKRRARGKRRADGFGTVDRFDPAKSGSVIRSITKPEQDLNLGHLSAHYDFGTKLLKQLADSHNADAKTRKLVQRYEDLSAQMADELAQVRKSSEAAERAQELETVVPRLAVRALEMVDQAGAILKMSKVTQKVELQVSRAVKGVTSRLGSGKPRRTIVPAIESFESGESRREHYARRRREVRDMLEQPERLASRASRMANPSHAPNVSTHVALKSARAAEFLDSVAPPGRTSHPLGRPDDVPVDEIQLRKWLRYLHAVENPMSVLEAMAEGDVTKEGIEALQAVYPKLYDRLLSDTFERLTEMDAPPSFSESVQLSLLFGVPMHYTLRPEFITSYQASFAQARQELDRSAPPSAISQRESRIAKRMQTPFQRVEAR